MINHPDKLQGKKRSSQWSAVRRVFLMSHPTCVVCGSKTKIEVHHIKPFHLHPELELDPANLITLCESGKGGVVCHLHFGHLGSYKKINKTVKKDANIWSKKMTIKVMHS